MPFYRKIPAYLRMIKFSHTVFALPFAFTGAVMASSGIPHVEKIVWIILAMVGARTAAMSLNRIIDRKIDSLNPRTKKREMPRGIVKTIEAAGITLLGIALLLISAYKLNPLCLKLSPIAIAVISIYPYTKRFTWLSHIILGLALSAAPVGAWIAVKDTFDLNSLPISFAVLFWVAGFDILYAMRDIDFDKSYGLYSIPKRFGIKNSLRISRILHFLTLAFLSVEGLLIGIGLPYWIGLAIATGLFAYEHSLIKKDDLSKLDMAFFNMNGYISITVFMFTLLSFL